MPALNFMDRFEQALENGIAEIYQPGFRPPHPGVRPKRQTFRAYRRDGRNPVPGQTLYLYVRQRRPDRRLLGMVECEIVEPVEICWSSIVLNGQRRWCDNMWDRCEMHEIAVADGFVGYADMAIQIEKMHGLRAELLLIRW